MEGMRSKISTSFDNSLTEVFDYFNNRIINLETLLDKQKQQITILETKCHNLEENYESVKTELADFQKVSIIKSLNSQLMDKNGEIKFLQGKLKQSSLEPFEESPKVVSEPKTKAKAKAKPKAKTKAKSKAEAEKIAEAEKVAEAEAAAAEVAEAEKVAAAEAEKVAAAAAAEAAEAEKVESAKVAVEVEVEVAAEADKVEAADKAEVVEDNDSEEEIEVSFNEKTIQGKKYFVTDDDDRDIYEKLSNDDIGDHVGSYNNKNRAIFFKK